MPTLAALVRSTRLSRALLVASVTLVPSAVHAQASGAAGNASAAAPVAFVNVNVVPMDSERVVSGQTVVIRDGRIAAMGPTASTAVPAGATRVDGRGKYLMPGLAEMHAHIPGGNAPEQLVHDIMFLYVANGVTTIRGMLGAPSQLKLREQTASGALLGPTIFVGAPSLNGNSAPNGATAARLVREHEAAGYDLLKLHPGLSRETYDSIMVTAKAVGITTGGHISEDVGLAHTLASGQATIDHLDGYIEAAVHDSLRPRMQSEQATFGEVMRSVEESKLRTLAEETRKAGVWNVPTAFLWESFFSPESPEAMAQRPEMRYATKGMLNGWIKQKQNQNAADEKNGVSAADRQRYLSLRRATLRALNESGAGILMGTDSPQMFNVPGFALHREVALMAEVGMTPFQVLRSGTSNVAQYAANDLKLDGRFGTVAVGNRADLVLLDANPLESVGNLAKRSGVMVRGRWLPASEIERGLEAIAARNAAGE